MVTLRHNLKLFTSIAGFIKGGSHIIIYLFIHHTPSQSPDSAVLNFKIMIIVAEADIALNNHDT